MENQIQKIKKENNKLASKKLKSQLELLLHGQEISRSVNTSVRVLIY